MPSEVTNINFLWGVVLVSKLRAYSISPASLTVVLRRWASPVTVIGSSEMVAASEKSL